MEIRSEDIRWHQLFNSFSKVFSQLERFVAEKELKIRLDEEISRERNLKSDG